MTANWQEHGTIEIAGTTRSIWQYNDKNGKDVYQVTTGDMPTSDGGYHNLESLLTLKGVRLSDMQPVAAGPKI